MSIRFLCPNGHQLNAPENLVGKSGKCPKCNSPFVVPPPDDGEAPVEANLAPAVRSEADKTPELAAPKSGSFSPQAMIGEGSGKGQGSPANVFVFLCPNGHKLNGPPSLKGKPGQCPHCGERFRIPSDDDLEEPEEEVPVEAIAAQPRDSGSNFFFADLEQQAAEKEEVYDEAQVENGPQPPPPDVHALGYIVGRLWERKGENSELEIYLSEGEIVSPDFYAEVLSSREYGVFASKDGEANYSVTVIPWTAVRKVGIRKLDELPDQMFQ